jgi:hypothetical protein
MQEKLIQAEFIINFHGEVEVSSVLTQKDAVIKLLNTVELQTKAVLNYYLS